MEKNVVRNMLNGSRLVELFRRVCEKGGSGAQFWLTRESPNIGFELRRVGVGGMGRLEGVEEGVSPSEEALVRDPLENLLLQADEGMSSLSIQSRHVDVEDTEERVRAVLGPLRLPPGRPRHALRHARLPPPV